ncbi:hypothetical protein K8B83_10090 [Shewanella inventionis]|uniref:glycosyltransferase n=1 Tax=Shewanella inventionis TaxID=1738770 RepID=UPI001CBBEF7E|nr:glycosyltransferase [Shewanella inventionis]UAL45123.1 hypothetical protein K8B83_10090 [Shewanella inventionis]
MMNVFLTVGAQLPFPRLIKAVDEIAKEIDCNVIAQIGNDNNVYSNCTAHKFIDSKSYEQLVNWADLIIAHAGMGTIITCLELSKPCVIVPRNVLLKEHRNNHQFDTANKFKELTDENTLLQVCYDTNKLKYYFNQSHSPVTPFINRGAGSIDSLVNKIEELIR